MDGGVIFGSYMEYLRAPCSAQEFPRQFLHTGADRKILVPFQRWNFPRISCPDGVLEHVGRPRFESVGWAIDSGCLSADAAQGRRMRLSPLFFRHHVIRNSLRIHIAFRRLGVIRRFIVQQMLVTQRSCGRLRLTPKAPPRFGLKINPDSGFRRSGQQLRSSIT